MLNVIIQVVDYYNHNLYVFINAQVVNQLFVEHVGNSIVLDKTSLLQFPWWTEDKLICWDELYVVTCQYYWQNVSMIKVLWIHERKYR